MGKRKRSWSLYVRRGFGWLSVPLPWGFRIGHRIGRRGRRR